MQDFKPTTFTVGLTGGIGSGKTVCSDHFASLGVPVIDTDLIARLVVEPGQIALTQLVNQFGDTILLEDGRLDRAELRRIAFANAENKQKLDAITHPAIRQETTSQISQVTYPYCLVVIPLLTSESPFSHFLKRVLAVSCDLETRVARVMQRSGLSREEVIAIMATQLSDNEREHFADDIIANNGSIAAAQEQVESLHLSYLEAALAH